MTAARYFDGQTPQAIPVDVRLTIDGITLWRSDGTIVASYLYSDLKVVDDGMSKIPRVLTSFSNGACRLVFATAQDAQNVITQLPPRAWPRVRIGVSSRSILMWAAAAIVAGFGLVKAFPLIVAPVTALIPYAAEKSIGDGLMKGVTKQWPACNDLAGQRAIENLVARLMPESRSDRAFKVHVLSSKAVNAFAIPGNHIVVLSGLILKAESPDEVAGVVAHEIAHQMKRHPMMGLVRSVGATVLMSAIFGGVTPEAVTSWGAALYTLSFSRDAEREADALAVKLLTEADIDVAGFSAFFKRIDEKDSSATAKAFSYLSSHPPTPDRISEVEKSRAGQSKTLRPAMNAEDWVSLRGMCNGDEADDNQRT